MIGKFREKIHFMAKHQAAPLLVTGDATRTPYTPTGRHFGATCLEPAFTTKGEGDRAGRRPAGLGLARLGQARPSLSKGTRYSRDSLCYGARARMTYINTKL